MKYDKVVLQHKVNHGYGEKRMKRLRFVYLSVLYYWGCLIEVLMAFWFDLEYFCKHKRFAKRGAKGSEEQRNFWRQRHK